MGSEVRRGAGNEEATGHLEWVAVYNTADAGPAGDFPRKPAAYRLVGAYRFRQEGRRNGYWGIGFRRYSA